MTEKEGKLHNIKETASDAVAIMRELGTPGVQESFEVIREIAVIAKEIMETMKTPEWQQNMENIRVISQNINSVSATMNKSTSGLKETGVIDDAKDLIKVVRSKMDSFGGASISQQSAGGEGEGGGEARAGISGQDLKDLGTSFKEMLEAVKALAWELRVTVEDSKKSGTIRNIDETFREASGTYRTVKEEVDEAKK
jgi:hypothetical protein